MATFDEIRQQLHQARVDLDAKGDAAFAAGERLWRIERQQEELRRIFDPQNGEHVQHAAALEAAHAKATGEIQDARDKRDIATGIEAGLFGQFAQLSNPIDAIGRLDDNVPILLLPVRLETRFKGTQLWVRVYPDDVSVDTFEPLLSQSEVMSAKEYWTGVWQGHPFEDQVRGAWRGLVASHGSGRAAWILDVKEYKPINMADLQPKAKATDVVLTLPTEELPNPLETDAIGDYWVALWQADGDAQKSQDAFEALAAATNASRAEEIANGPRPSNFDTVPAPPDTKASVTATFSWVVFPKSEPLDLKESSWARAARAVLLPDRFVFIGYREGAQPRVAVGLPVPSSLVVGPDPSAPEDERLRRDDDGNLIIPDDMKWMVDFNRAVQVGMGFRLDLDAAEAAGGFDRVLVVGIRAGDDATESAQALATLIEHHRFSRTGFEIVPQGTPTNNTESTSTPFVRGADADASFDDRKTGDLFQHSGSWLDKQDGQWLAEWLGLEEATFLRVHGAGGRDQSDARAMNVALWPATIDYWMESLMDPVFDAEEISQTRDFFTTFVSGRGAVPAIRVGRQPYGILPATALSRMAWLRPKATGATDRPSFPARLYEFLLKVDEQWRTLVDKVAYAGKEDGDPHQNLLDVIGLHSGAANWSYRWAESAQQYWNQLKLGGFAQLLIGAIQHAAAIQLLNDFGWPREPYPNLLEKFFFGKHDPLSGPIVDDVPLSETAPIRGYTDDHRNYIQWLIDASKTSLQALYAQDGFTDDKPPKALLYLLLRHALQLGFHDAAVRLHREHGLLDAVSAKSAKRDDPFIHVREQAPQSESRYQILYKTEPVISATQPVGQFIAASMPTLPAASGLFRQRQALELLKDASTARLERAFAEHVDCCTYRLDAWLLGLVHAQLTFMRNNFTEGPQAPPRRKGIYLGAYAWLEELRPENKVLTPYKPEDPELAKIFADPADPPLVRDSKNFGYIHAPSLNHAVAAAVLRNGYMSNASPANRKSLAVNLSSERVRTAVALIEGIRAGQGLGALLGYQFERGMHDRNATVNVDQYIFDLRLAFPLAGKRIKSTQDDIPEGTSIEKIEARNVIDGLALVNQIKVSGTKTYPFGKPGLPAISDPDALSVIKDEADRLVESHDAVADLALAEGVYQAVIGNYDRVASTYDAYAKGEFPPEPQVVRTPSNGVGLTHRIALHLRSGLSPNDSPLGAGVPMTPRAQAEPAVNRWLFDMLPPLGDVGCVVSFRDAVTNADVELQVTLLDLKVQPADFLRLFRDDSRQEMAELDDRIVRHVFTTETPRPETQVEIRYMEKTTAKISVFEILPLLRQLRRLVTTSRPLRSSDSSRTNEAKKEQDAAVFVDPARVTGVHAALGTLRDDLQDFIDGVSPDPLARVADFETYLAGVVELLARAAELGIPQTGWGFAYDAKRRLFRSVLDKVAAIVARWDERLAKLDDLLLAYDPTAEEQTKLNLLAQAALQITTAPLPQTGLADDIKVTLETTTRDEFLTKRTELITFLGTNGTTVPQLLTDAEDFLPLSAFDVAEVSFADETQMAILFADDAVSVAQVVLDDAEKRLAAADDHIEAHGNTSDPAARVEALDAAAKTLLGDDVFLVPEFNLSAKQGDELANAVTASTSGTLLQHLVASDPFPVDTWLYGVARVREKVRSLEQVVMLTEAFEVAPPELTPLQLPFVENEGWYALELPPDVELHPERLLNSDRLLYTAAFSAAPFDKTAPVCGLLLDEWTEVIPTPEVETGIAFHYDRPSCEAPQSLLLVTPSDFRGEWQWNDLVDALNETLDFAKRRAVEPDQIDATPYARFLPATVSAVTKQQITISALFALNNNFALPEGDA
ncbi:MAG TPA: hypothetical protein VH394_23600 [Thermoanaerobaculia bacterium]|jgi:hypothetical protein|nr:hypothetical protein [Thermoanaerobaculia bacterium]